MTTTLTLYYLPSSIQQCANYFVSATANVAAFRISVKPQVKWASRILKYREFLSQISLIKNLLMG